MKKHNLDLIRKKYSEKELEEYIKFFSDYDLEVISYTQNLSEEFIEKYSDKVDWYYISSRQNLSEEFIRKHINKIHISWLMNNNFISRKLKNKIKKEIKTLKEII
jgi:hypothetical protein